MSHFTWTDCCGHYTRTGTCVLCKASGCTLCIGIKTYWTFHDEKPLLTCQKCRQANGVNPCDFCSQVDMSVILEPLHDASLQKTGRKRKRTDGDSGAATTDTVMYCGKRKRICASCLHNGWDRCNGCEKITEFANMEESVCCPELLCHKCHKKHQRSPGTYCNVGKPCDVCEQYRITRDMIKHQIACRTCPAWKQEAHEQLDKVMIPDLWSIVMEYISLPIVSETIKSTQPEADKRWQ
jgi:hypothetical protein